MRAYELLNEAVLAEAKSVHMTHLEDLLLDRGYDGAVEALSYAESVRNMLAKGKGDRGNVTVKWDGSPAIFAGTDPSDGKFFVGTKAVLSKNPKYIKSPADVRKYYNDQPDLGKTLLAAHKFLQKLGISGVVQGDLMFTEGEVTTEDFDGEAHYVFTPNTITYAVPVDSDLGRTIARAKLGIVLHTTHEAGESLRDTEMSFGVDISGLNDTPDVWVDDATYKDYTGVVSLTPEEDKNIKQEIAAATKRLKQLGKANFETIISNPDFKRHIQPFINKRVRTGEYISDTTEFVKGFFEFFQEKTKKGIEDLKPNFQQKRLDKIDAKKAFLEENEKALYALLDLYVHLNNIKLLLIKKLNVIDGVKTFIKSEEGGYDVTNPEGFVAIGSDGNAVKLVDRLEFSKMNFARRY